MVSVKHTMAALSLHPSLSHPPVTCNFPGDSTSHLVPPSTLHTVSTSPHSATTAGFFSTSPSSNNPSISPHTIPYPFLLPSGFLPTRFAHASPPGLPYGSPSNPATARASPTATAPASKGSPTPRNSKRSAGSPTAAACIAKRTRLNSQLTTTTFRGYRPTHSLKRHTPKRTFSNESRAKSSVETLPRIASPKPHPSSPSITLSSSKYDTPSAGGAPTGARRPSGRRFHVRVTPPLRSSSAEGVFAARAAAARRCAA
mmetsp:Transcript_1632/g.4364  ORF Transcript_1632/g.4364 Transcript_1632/m.4364 type:complete len:257 (-) Transcript_1632:167-937(-)